MTNSWISFCTLIICLVFGIEEVIAKTPSYRSIGNPNDVDITKYPWQAAVVPTSDDIFLCGAVIISKTHLLTSADCIKSNSLETSHVTIGSSIFDEGVKYQLKSNHTHPNHTGYYPFLDDIAVIEIDGEIEFDETKSPAELPDNVVPIPIGATVTLTGWGLELAGSFSKNLRKQDLIITENHTCDVIIADITGNDVQHITDPMGPGQVCGLTSQNTPNCQVNMGTGIVSDGTIIGIAIAGTPCGEGLPEFVTRVHSYVDWIREVINN